MHTTALILHILSLVAASEAGPLRRRLPRQPQPPAAKFQRQISQSVSDGRITITIVPSEFLPPATTTTATASPPSTGISTSAQQSGLLPTSYGDSTFVTSARSSTSLSAGSQSPPGAGIVTSLSASSASSSAVSSGISPSLASAISECLPPTTSAVSSMSLHSILTVPLVGTGHSQAPVASVNQPPVTSFSASAAVSGSSILGASTTMSAGTTLGSAARSIDSSLIPTGSGSPSSAVGLPSASTSEGSSASTKFSASATASTQLPAASVSVQPSVTGAPNSDIPTFISYLPPSTTTVSASVFQNNLQAAREFNDMFATLTKQSSCTLGQAACIGGWIGRCGSGSVFEVGPCPVPGTACFALPMNTTEGVILDCKDVATAKRILGTIPDAMVPSSSVSASLTAPSTVSPIASSTGQASLSGSASASTSASASASAKISSTSAADTFTDPITRTATVTVSTGVATITLMIEPHTTPPVPTSAASPLTPLFPISMQPIVLTPVASSATPSASPSSTPTSKSESLVVIPITNDPASTTVQAPAASSTSLAVANGGAVVSSSSSSSGNGSGSRTLTVTQLVTVTQKQTDTVTAVEMTTVFTTR